MNVPAPGTWHFGVGFAAIRLETVHLGDDDAVPSWHVQKISVAMASPRITVGLRPGIGLGVIAPLRAVRTTIRFEDLNRLPFEPPGGDIHHRDETLVGIADPEIGLLLGRMVGSLSLTGRLGVSLPLGRNEDNPFELGRQGVTHQHIQFGTGTWDPLLGLGLARRIGPLGAALSADARWTLSQNDRGYQAGDRYGATATLSREFIPAWRGSAGMLVAREESERWNGRLEEEGNLGRTDVRLTLGISRMIVSLGSLSLDAQIPLVTRSSGEQVDYPVSFMLGWRR